MSLSTDQSRSTHQVQPTSTLTMTINLATSSPPPEFNSGSVNYTSDTNAPFETITSSARNKPIIAIAGLAIETSTFSPLRTTLPSQFRPVRGEDITNVKYASFLGPTTELGDKADWKGTLIGHAMPGGVVIRSVFDSLVSEICSRLFELVEHCKRRKRPLEGLWFDIHGAMVVQGLKDAENVMLRRIRAVVGDDVLISASMDLHGNVSRELCHGVDLLTAYRTAPHVDYMETKERACRQLYQLIVSRRWAVSRSGAPLTDLKAGKWWRPFKAWIPVPILLGGEQTSTRVEPAKGLYGMIPELIKRCRLIDASILVGYAWADEERCKAVVVVTGYQKEHVKAAAEKLAGRFWEVHDKFDFVAPVGTYKECLDAALQSKESERPYFISDSGDNPTAGGSGDVTWGLTKLLQRKEFQKDDGPTVIYASLPGPSAVKTAVEAGVGATITVTAGAEVDNIHAGPLTMTGRVHSIKKGDPDALTEVVLRVGSVYAIITDLRKPYHHEKDFLDLDLKPREADVVIVKIGYLEPELYDMAKGWMMALTPGGVDQDLVRLGHKRISRPMWPFDKRWDSEPDLRARFVAPADEVDHMDDE